MNRLFVSAGLILLSASCGGDSAVSGAFARFETDLTFPEGTGRQELVFDARDRPEIAETDFACGYVSLAQSFLAVVEHDGTDGAPFTLTATIVDGATETQMFSWQGNLQNGGRQVAFETEDSGFRIDAADALAAILTRDDPSYTVRFDYSAPTSPLRATVRIVQHLEFAADAAECP